MSIDMKFGMILEHGSPRAIRDASNALIVKDAAAIDAIYNRVVSH